MLKGILFMLLFCSGCASTWTLKTESADIALQWPYQPNKAKVTYIAAITGFVQKNPAQSVLNAIVYGTGGDTSDTLIRPVGVAAGPDGRLAVADTGCRCVHLYIPGEEKYRRLFGAEKEEFTSPVSVTFDEAMNLFVADSEAGKVFVFGKEGAFLFSFHTVSSGHLKRPTGLSYDRQRRLLYVVDTLDNTINAFAVNGDFIFSFGKRGEEKGSFNFPSHIFLSPDGRLYVTDTLNFRVESFDSKGAFLGSFGHHGDGSGDFAMPKGVAVDKDGYIYVVDSFFDNIQIFNMEGEFLLTLGRRGSDFGEFWLPNGIFIDDAGTLYVCDTYNRRVQMFRIADHYADEKL